MNKDELLKLIFNTPEAYKLRDELMWTSARNYFSNTDCPLEEIQDENIKLV